MLDVRAVNEATSGPPQAIDTSGDAAALRLTAGRFARGLTEETASVDAAGLVGARLAAFVEGLVLGSYRYSMRSAQAADPDRSNAQLKNAQHKHSQPANARGNNVKRIDLVGVEDHDAMAEGLRHAAATVWARELSNEPASVKSPIWLAAQAARELAREGVEVRVHDERWLAGHGFGGVLAVGGGSANPPRLIQASWRPRRATPGVHAVVVGKGVTFDTGGLNIKPGAAMRSMHTDMAGGAAALAALRAVAAARTGTRVTVLVPVAENSVSGSAFRPGDVVRHFGGRTSEITNTDAEGRIVLADALAYAVARLRPSVLVDIATLTGAMKVTLGLRTAGVFATQDALAGSLIAAGAAADEPLWRMPLVEEYRESLDSTIADADNAPGNPGAITAALFLQPFAGSVPWAHLDIAGPARVAQDDGVSSRGASGFGARLLARWLESLT
ncbi:MAG: peptidase M17 [Actinomycetota bacterium]|nr:peptidase M17 [Actinomycetota bacterium]